MKVLLTGAFGNLGTYTLGELLRQNHDVRAFDLPTTHNVQVARPFGGRVEIAWGDIRDVAAVAEAVVDVDVVIHLAAIIPPASDKDPELSWQVNVDGTRHLLEACRTRRQAPRFFFASSYNLFGRTQKEKPPRRASDPTEITDVYTRAKSAGERMVRESNLEWLVARFASMPMIALREADPIMFEIGLDNRFEVLHPADGALAIVNTLRHPDLWGGKSILVGGGPTCQITYREFLFGVLGAMGIGGLPEAAFSSREYITDWLDSEESRTLLQYQRHSFEDIIDEISRLLGWRRLLMPLARPFLRAKLLKLSPYYKKKG
jgi:nucleoside-diphosphate-sugar epimerase